MLRFSFASVLAMGLAGAALAVEACGTTETRDVVVPADATPPNVVVEAGAFRDVQVGDARATPIPCAPQPLDAGYQTLPLSTLGRYPGVCTDAELQTLGEGCLLGAAVLAPCQEARAAAPSCTDCVFGRAFTLDLELDTVIVRDDSCVALVENDAGAAGCAARANERDACELAACGSVCPADAKGSLADFVNCVAHAVSVGGVCAEEEARFRAACPAAPLGATDASAGFDNTAQCFGTLLKGDALDYTRVICGFEPDAGIGDAGEGQ